MWHKAESFVTDRAVVRSIRELKDTEILKSHLFLLWSERWPLRPDGLSEMHASVCEDFSGIGIGYHRVDLIRILDRFLEQLDRERGPPVRVMEDQYRSLKEALVEEEKKASDTLTGTYSRTLLPFDIFTQVMYTDTHLTFVCALPLMCL